MEDDNMPKIWVTSDWHLFHDQSFIYEPRGFSSVDEMNEEILRRHNERVSDEDDVYILGDILLGGPITEEKLNYLKKFKGKLHLAFGNHDTPAKLKEYEQSDIFEDIQMGYRLIYRRNEFWLTHHPTVLVNPGNAKPIYNIHGHTHEDHCFNEFPNCYNVNPEAHDSYPIDMETIFWEIHNNLKC